MDIKKVDITNPEFATSTHYGENSLTAEKLKSILENDRMIYRLFQKRGHIQSQEFSFITYATFSEEINSELDGKYNGNKSPERIQQARERVYAIISDRLIR